MRIIPVVLFILILAGAVAAQEPGATTPPTDVGAALTSDSPLASFDAATTTQSSAVLTASINSLSDADFQKLTDKILGGEMPGAVEQFLSSAVLLTDRMQQLAFKFLSTFGMTPGAGNNFVKQVSGTLTYDVQGQGYGLPTIVSSAPGRYSVQYGTTSIDISKPPAFVDGTKLIFSTSGATPKLVLQSPDPSTAGKTLDFAVPEGATVKPMVDGGTPYFIKFADGTTVVADALTLAGVSKQDNYIVLDGRQGQVWKVPLTVAGTPANAKIFAMDGVVAISAGPSTPPRFSALFYEPGKNTPATVEIGTSGFVTARTLEKGTLFDGNFEISAQNGPYLAHASLKDAAAVKDLLVKRDTFQAEYDQLVKEGSTSTQSLAAIREIETQLSRNPQTLKVWLGDGDGGYVQGPKVVMNTGTGDPFVITGEANLKVQSEKRSTTIEGGYEGVSASLNFDNGKPVMKMLSPGTPLAYTVTNAENSWDKLQAAARDLVKGAITSDSKAADLLKNIDSRSSAVDKALKEVESTTKDQLKSLQKQADKGTLGDEDRGRLTTLSDQLSNIGMLRAQAQNLPQFSGLQDGQRQYVEGAFDNKVSANAISFSSIDKDRMSFDMMSLNYDGKNDPANTKYWENFKPIVMSVGMKDSQGFTLNYGNEENGQYSRTLSLDKGSLVYNGPEGTKQMGMLKATGEVQEDNQIVFNIDRKMLFGMTPRPETVLERGFKDYVQGKLPNDPYELLRIGLSADQQELKVSVNTNMKQFFGDAPGASFAEKALHGFLFDNVLAGGSGNALNSALSSFDASGSLQKFESAFKQAAMTLPPGKIPDTTTFTLRQSDARKEFPTQLLGSMADLAHESDATAAKTLRAVVSPPAQSFVDSVLQTNPGATTTEVLAAAQKQAVSDSTTKPIADELSAKADAARQTALEAVMNDPSHPATRALGDALNKIFTPDVTITMTQGGKDTVIPVGAIPLPAPVINQMMPVLQSEINRPEARLFFDFIPSAPDDRAKLIAEIAKAAESSQQLQGVTNALSDQLSYPEMYAEVLARLKQEERTRASPFANIQLPTPAPTAPVVVPVTPPAPQVVVVPPQIVPSSESGPMPEGMTGEPGTQPIRPGTGTTSTVQTAPVCDALSCALPGPTLKDTTQFMSNVVAPTLRNVVALPSPPGAEESNRETVSAFNDGLSVASTFEFLLQFKSSEGGSLALASKQDDKGYIDMTITSTPPAGLPQTLKDLASNKPLHLYLTKQQYAVFKAQLGPQMQQYVVAAP